MASRLVMLQTVRELKELLPTGLVMFKYIDGYVEPADEGVWKDCYSLYDCDIPASFGYYVEEDVSPTSED